MELEEGLYKMPFSEYQQIQAVNCSRLTAYAQTPAHALIQKPETSAMRLGRAIHCAVLEPKLYETRWATMPDGMIRRGKKWEEWQEEHKEAEILSAEEEATIRGIVQSLGSGYYETARKLIELCGNDTEMVLVWKHRKFDCWCKARLDGFTPSNLGIIVDLKSTGNADPKQWIRTAINYSGHPHWQPSWYLKGAQAILGPEYETFLWILVETKEPFGISVVQASPPPEGQNNMIFLAQLQMDLTLERYLESDRTGNFPGYPDKIVMGELPAWYIKGAL